MSVPDIAGRDLPPGGYSFDVSSEAKKRLAADAAKARARWRGHTEPGHPEPLVDPQGAARTLSDESLSLIHGPRADEYAPPEVNLPRIGAAWAAVLGLPEAIPGWRVALCMAALKVVRAGHKPGDDSLVDAVGYLELARKLRP